MSAVATVILAAWLAARRARQRTRDRSRERDRARRPWIYDEVTGPCYPPGSHEARERGRR